MNWVTTDKAAESYVGAVLFDNIIQHENQEFTLN